MPKRKPGRKKNKPITEKDLIYMQAKALTGSEREAKKIANISLKVDPEKNNPAVKESMKDYKRFMDRKFIEQADMVANELLELVMNAKSETAKLGAIKDWLDRAGLAPVNKTETTTREIGTGSQVAIDLIHRLNKLDNKKGGE